MQNLFLLFSFFGGLGLFIYGMDRLADGLQKTAGNRMKSILGALTNNRFMGVLTGAGVTAIVQSSSATTVMIVGFVNAGIMTLMQAMGVIMGANIGTTITSWIVSSAEWLKFLKPSTIAPLAIGVGVFMMVGSKKKNIKQIGEIIAGFGILFLGLDLMKDAVHPFSDSPVFADLFVTLGKNPILGILAGAAVTAIVQSSSASVGILQTIAVMGLVPWNAAVYIILGQNIGTCVTAMISSVGANKTAKRAAYMHLLFNVVGSIAFAVIMILIFMWAPSFANGQVTMTGISIFHTVFNITVTVALFPFGKQIVKLSGLFVSKEKNVKQKEEDIVRSHLDERILETPGLALENAKNEIVRMGELAFKNLDAGYQIIAKKDSKKLEEIFEVEQTINNLETIITDYLVKINNSELNEHQVKTVTGLFHVINDIERIADHAENIGELVREYYDNDVKFSDAAFKELEHMFNLSKESLNAAIEVRRDFDAKLLRKVKQNEEIIDAMEVELRKKHINRLSQNICVPASGVIFLDIISNLERVSDHAMNIAEFVEEEHDDL